MEMDHENHELTPIYVCEDDEEAQIIIGFLESNDIEAMSDSNSAMPFENDTRVFVHVDDADKAKKLLEDRDA